MKLIIDIPKELKSEVYRCGVFLSLTEKESLINAINKGIPLDDWLAKIEDEFRPMSKEVKEHYEKLASYYNGGTHESIQDTNDGK